MREIRDLVTLQVGEVDEESAVSAEDLQDAGPVEIIGCPTHEPDEAEECTIDEE